jgi:ketol-acid reductoisomerase
VNLAKPMKRILQGIRSGAFAREWSFEQRTGRLRYRFLLAMAQRLPMGKVEQAVRKVLGLP